MPRAAHGSAAERRVQQFPYTQQLEITAFPSHIQTALFR
jgi:hypothetical protein